MIRGFSSSLRAVSNVSIRSFSEQAAAAAAAKPVRKSVKKMANRPCVIEQRARNAALEAKATESKLGWRLVGATILQRYPVITREAEKWETDMWDVQDKISDKKREALFNQIGGTDSQLITDMNPSYQEILDSMPFTPASRTTEADLKNDRHSIDRRLKDSLFLIVKRNRGDNQWQFPQGKWAEGETMRLTSERVVDRAIGKTKRYFIGNAPVGHYCYEYPKALQEKRGNFGAKIFFHRAQLVSGSIKLQTKLYTDYAWIARDEVGEYFDKDTASFLQYLLLD